jgi:chaperonin GroES
LTTLKLLLYNSTRYHRMPNDMTKHKLNLQPTAGYVVIEPLEAEEKTAAGIYLPETASEKPQKGKVLAVGGDETTDSGTIRKSPVKAGDVVIFKKWGGSEVKIDTKEYLFAKFDDILAVVTA